MYVLFVTMPRSLLDVFRVGVGALIGGAMLLEVRVLLVGCVFYIILVFSDIWRLFLFVCCLCRVRLSAFAADTWFHVYV